MNKWIVTSSIVICGTLLTTNQGFADTSTDDEWNFSLAPLFLWGMSQNGTSQVGPATTPLDLNFKDDVFENLDAVLTLHFEAQKNDLTLFAEYQYVDLAPTTELPDGQQVDIGFENTMAELGLAYALSKSGSTKWEVLGGLRYTKQELSANGIPSPPAPVSTLSTEEDWTDVFVGGRVFVGFADKWEFIGRADAGGGGSDLVWNLVGMFDYRFTDWGSAFFGYKIMDYDYDNGESGVNRYAYDARQQGPLAGLNIHW